MNVRAVVIDLPDFDQCIANRIAAGVEDFAAEVSHVTHGRRDRIVDDEQIVVRVERQMIGIERALRHLRRADAALKFLGKNTRFKKSLDEKRRGECASAYEPAAAGK